MRQTLTTGRSKVEVQGGGGGEAEVPGSLLDQVTEYRPSDTVWLSGRLRRDYIEDISQISLDLIIFPVISFFVFLISWYLFPHISYFLLNLTHSAMVDDICCDKKFST